MSIAFRGTPVASQSASGSSDIDVVLPTGHVLDDVLLIFVGNADGGNPLTTPTGWVSLDRTDQSLYLGEQVFWRVDNGSLGADIYIHGTSGLHPLAAVSYALYDADQTQPAAAKIAAQIGYASTILYNGLGTWPAVNGIDLAVAALEMDQQTTLGAPAGYTPSTSSAIHDAGTWITVGTAYAVLSAVTTVGGLSSAWVPGDPYVSHHVFIAEAAGAGPVGSVQAIVA
jgi:hypothetical protein